jgi:hypothetical protein
MRKSARKSSAIKPSKKTREEIINLSMNESGIANRTYNYKTRQMEYEPISRSFIDRVDTDYQMYES